MPPNLEVYKNAVGKTEKTAGNKKENTLKGKRFLEYRSILSTMSLSVNCSEGPALGFGLLH